MADLSKINEIDDEAQLQKMLSSTENIDDRKIIRNRLLAVKEIKSKEREKQMKEQEKRREQEIAERKQRKEDEKRNELKRFEEMSKTSTADRIHTDSSKTRDDYLKEKLKSSEEEKRKNIESFEQTAKSSSTHERIDIQNSQSKTSTSSSTSASSSSSSSVSKTSSLSTASKTSTAASKQKASTAAAFSVFQNKDKEVGGTGKATTTVTATNNNPNSPQNIKDNLLRWCQIRTQGYPNVNITNFSSSWADGMAFCALVHSFVPEVFDFSKLNPKNRRGNFTLAFKVAEDKCDVSPLLDVEDMLLMGNKPDYKCVFTYVQSFYRKFEIEPRARAGVSTTVEESC